MHYYQMKRSVGVSVLLLITLIAYFIYFIVTKKGYFETNYSYYFSVNDASSLRIDTPLNYSGFTIGRIEEMMLLNNGKAQMKFSLNQQNRHWIRKNTVLVIKRPLIGASYIKISAIDNTSPLLEPDSYLQVEMNDDINDIIEQLEPIVKKATHIVNNIEKITFRLADEDSPLHQSIQNINKITNTLSKNDALITTLTGDKNVTKEFIKSLDNVYSILNNTNKISQNFVRMSASLDTKIITPSANSLKNIAFIMKDIRNKLGILEGTIQELGKYKKDLGYFREEITSTLHKSNKIIHRVDRILEGNSPQKVELP